MFYVPPEGPPQNILPNPKIYSVMGEEAIFQMLEDFYFELSKSSISHMFPEDFKQASRKSAAFFVQILGGPPLYQSQYGSPRMRQRHLAFAIDEAARQVWLECFRKILKNAPSKYHFPLEDIDQFYLYLEKFSAWMVNTKTNMQKNHE